MKEGIYLTGRSGGSTSKLKKYHMVKSDRTLSLAEDAFSSRVSNTDVDMGVDMVSLAWG